ncbi:carboxypeptidase regulatory-like domain-containing protein [Geomonas sp.]|uniref:carboxypeptidase regulatory-like domain-containing protein n=1 Tax=Geomonas sp. TaxID=2651584 RepID=UPI002B46A634|nr:carboxypeptidase regulatory-like domain-containing protein [Geomonas sp.]HJV35326.1 carboxypeptidase regulatory-like domain-containing protein [Geomonas sp.]
MAREIGRGLPCVLGIIILAIALAACGGGGGGVAGSSGTATGVVTDIATGAPVAGVTISDGIGTAVTGANGSFALARPAGKYTLIISAAGYQTSSRVCSITAGSNTVFNLALNRAHAAYVNYTGANSSQWIPAAGMDYIIVAWNDLGMHCAQDDYSYFCILPPFNTLHAQVIKRGSGVVTEGVTVSYSFPKKTDSTLHTNFWSYAARYGWNVAPNVGITGTRLAGTMSLDANNLGFQAVGIPITPYDDDGTWDPYGTATITATDSATGVVLASTAVVAPVSTELDCSNCHGSTDTFLNILKSHDKLSGTSLAADQANGVLHLCAECHADNALGLPGKVGVKSLSLAMHGYHKGNVSPTPGSNSACYNCHPGPNTNCLRGVMYHAGQTCSDCHGDLYAMTASLQNGRRPWLDEPQCGGCHGKRYQENTGVLYRNSVFNNAPEGSMNGKLYCEACHNSTHAEYPSTNAADNLIPRQLQGDGYWLWNCYVCHTDYMPHASMHR